MPSAMPFPEAIKPLLLKLELVLSGLQESLWQNAIYFDYLSIQFRHTTDWGNP